MMLWILLLLPFVLCGAFLHEPLSMLGNRNSGDWCIGASSSRPSSHRRRTNDSSISKPPPSPLRLAVEDEEDLSLSALKNDCRSHRRRDIATSATAAAAWLAVAAAANPPPASAAPPSSDAVSSSSASSTPMGLLETRVTENVLSPPPYLMETDDIYYPSWFSGTWQVRSVCTDVMAPCETALFGGETKYRTARLDIGKPILYESRFLPVMVPSSSSSSSTSSGSEETKEACIADREYNVVSIAKATMGNASIVNVATSTPNRLSVLLALGNGSGSGGGNISTGGGGGGLVQADLITLHRRQERIDNTRFDCAEAVQEVVSFPKSSSSSSSSAGPIPITGPMILKQIETASLYRLVEQPPERGNDNKKMLIQCRQRSATFLLPSQQDPVALRLWQLARGRPIDVRFYDDTFSR